MFEKQCLIVWPGPYGSDHIEINPIPIQWYSTVIIMKIDYNHEEINKKKKRTNC